MGVGKPACWDRILRTQSCTWEIPYGYDLEEASSGHQYPFVCTTPNHSDTRNDRSYSAECTEEDDSEAWNAKNMKSSII